MSEPKNEKLLVFQDNWCQIWYNPFREVVAIEDRDEDGLTVVLSLNEWWHTSVRILQIRNSSDPKVNRGILQETESPKVRAKLSRDKKTFKIICPYCGETHTHGAGENGNLYGHRVAHCSNRSEESNAGYILIPEEK